MKVIFISSAELASGRTLLAWSIFRALKGLGVSFDIVKLGGLQSEADRAETQLIEDALKIQPKIVGISEITCPEPNAILSKVCPSSQLVVILGTHKIFSGAAPDEMCEVRLAVSLEPQMFLAIRYKDKANLLYTALTLKSYLGKRLAGVLINRVPTADYKFTLERIAKDLKLWGVPLIAVLPEDRVLKSATINEYASLISGELLVEGDNQESLVESYTLGTSAYQGRFSMFKRLWQRIALLGGKKLELEDPKFSARITGIIAAGRFPPETALDVARAEKVAVIYTKSDAFVVTEQLERAIFHPTLEQPFRIERFEKLLKEQVDLKELILHALE